MIKKSIRSNHFKVIQFCLVLQTLTSGFFTLLTSSNNEISKVFNQNIPEVLTIFTYSLVINLVVIVFSITIIILSRGRLFKDRSTSMNEVDDNLNIYYEKNSIKIRYINRKVFYEISEVLSFLFLIFAIFFPLWKFLNILNINLNNKPSSQLIASNLSFNIFIGIIIVIAICSILFTVYFRTTNIISELIINVMYFFKNVTNSIKFLSDKINLNKDFKPNFIQVFNELFSYEEISEKKSYLTIYFKDKILMQNIIGDRLIGAFKIFGYNVIVLLKNISTGKIVYFYIVSDSGKVIDKSYFIFNNKYRNINENFSVSNNSNEITLFYYDDDYKEITNSFKLIIHNRKKIRPNYILNSLFIGKGIAYYHSKYFGTKSNLIEIVLKENKKLLVLNNFLFYMNVFFLIYLFSNLIKYLIIKQNFYNVIFYILFFIILLVYLKNFFRFYNKPNINSLITLILVSSVFYICKYNLLSIFFSISVFLIFITLINYFHIYYLNNDDIKYKNSWI